MIKWAEEHSMPESLLTVVPAGGPLASYGGDDALSAEQVSELWAIPCEYEDFPDTEGICLTGSTQLKWLGQCVHSLVR